MTAAPLLEVAGLEAAYGMSQVLFGLSLVVREGEVVTLMGRNGMGKTTTARAIMGMLRPRGGAVRFRGHEIAGLASHRIARLGLGLVPEGRHIFPNLTVRENLLMAAAGRDGWTLDRVIRLFPRLGERLPNGGNQLSGGEQQMLAIGRALMTNPVLLILDEATEGLAPVIRDEIWHCLAELKRDGLAILVIDKELDALCALADRHVIIEKGEVAWTGGTAELLADPAIHETYLGV